MILETLHKINKFMDKNPSDETLKFIASATALSFLLLFIFIEKLPFALIFQLYLILTHQFTIMIIVTFSVLFLIISLKDKNYYYALVIIAFATGQFLFVNVYGDKYSLDDAKTPAKESQINKNQSDHHYSLYWNMG